LPEQIRAIVDHLPIEPAVDRVGVFADADLEEICRVVAIANLNAVQLHGSESPEFCDRLRSEQPDIEIIKALRVRNINALTQAQLYADWVDTLLLDAHHPTLLGGTGQMIDWSSLQAFSPNCPWILAGGITPANVSTALSEVQPDGIDLSSGVEHAPGDKDLVKVAELFDRLKELLGKQSATTDHTKS